MKRARHILAWLLIFAVAFVFAACGSPAQPSPSPSPTLSPTPVETPAPTPTPTPSPTYDPTLSPTTGLKYDGVYKPVAVVINNHPDARPQSGLQAADVVYEMTVEGGCSRFLAIFNDTLPEKVGSVRSSRVSLCDLWQEWQSIYCHWGGEGDMVGDNFVSLTFKTTGIQIRVDGMVDTKLMFRDKSKTAPHNGFVNVKGAAALYQTKNYQPPIHRFTFDAQADLSAWQSMSSVTIPYVKSNYVAKFVWDDAKKSYMRFTNGKPHTDKTTGKQIEVKNVVVLVMPHRTLPDLDHHVVINNVGTGMAYFFRDGKWVEGTWEKKSKQDQSVFKDKSGNVIQFTPGNTWFEIAKPEFKIDIK